MNMFSAMSSLQAAQDFKAKLESLIPFALPLRNTLGPV